MTSLTRSAKGRQTIATQGKQRIPQSLQALEDWWLVSDHSVGLHFCPAQLTHARIVRRLNGREPRLLIYSHADAPEPALVLESSDQRQALTWCELLHSVV